MSIPSPKNDEDEDKPPMAKVFKFGEDYRPVPLKKIVRGFAAASPWALSAQLDKALFPLLLDLQSDQNHKGKPVLVFCPTRKRESRPLSVVREWCSFAECQTTADFIDKMYTKQRQSGGLLPWDPPTMCVHSLVNMSQANQQQQGRYLWPKRRQYR